jgi:hypothetical protein
MKYEYKSIKVPISELSKLCLSKDDLNRLMVIVNYEGVSLGLYVAKLLKKDIDNKAFLFKKEVYYGNGRHVRGDYGERRTTGGTNGNHDF